MSHGWIKLHRRLVEHPRFARPGWAALWLCLLCEAAHSAHPTEWNGQVITLEPGQFVTGRKALAQATGLHESTVHRLLELMQKDGQIEQRTSSTSRLITVTKWAEYQQGEQPLNNERTTTEQRLNTTEEDKEGKNEKKTAGPKASAARNLVTEEVLTELEQSPAYAGIDVRREHAKCVEWCKTRKGTSPSRMRLINWLNRAEPRLPVAAAAVNKQPALWNELY